MSATPTPPGTVLGVQILLGAGFVVGFLLALPGGPFASGAPAPSWSSFLAFVATGTTAWVVGWAIQQGSAALGHVFSGAMVALCAAIALFDLNLHPAQWVQLAVFVVASALLYAPASQEWFAIRQAQRHDPVWAQALWQAADERRRVRERTPADAGTFISLCAVLAVCAGACAAVLASVPT